MPDQESRRQSWLQRAIPGAMNGAVDPLPWNHLPRPPRVHTLVHLLVHSRYGLRTPAAVVGAPGIGCGPLGAWTREPIPDI